MTARKAAHSLQRAKGALAIRFATVDPATLRGMITRRLSANSKCRSKPPGSLGLFFSLGDKKSPYATDTAL